jgi:hypothetical protein
MGFFDWLTISFTLIGAQFVDRHPAQHTRFSDFRFCNTFSFRPHLSFFDVLLQLYALHRELLI